MKSILLIGFMGCGKTTVGRMLSEKTRSKFVDTDEMIVRNEGRSINDIFATVGEEGFRRAETLVLSELAGLSGRGLIISTGGGIVTKSENIPLLKAAGQTVWLRVKPETVIKRLAGDTTRPLLKGSNPEEKVRKLMDERKVSYESAADTVIDCDDLTPDEIVNKVLQNCTK